VQINAWKIWGSDPFRPATPWGWQLIPDTPQPPPAK